MKRKLSGNTCLTRRSSSNSVFFVSVLRYEGMVFFPVYSIYQRRKRNDVEYNRRHAPLPLLLMRIYIYSSKVSFKQSFALIQYFLINILSMYEKMMKQEIDIAVHLLKSYVERFGTLEADVLEDFSDRLAKNLLNRYKGHWYTGRLNIFF